MIQPPLSLLLPLVAYRGLWDRFARPATVDAFRRAYARGVPCVLRAGNASPSAVEACRLIAHPSVNRRDQPLYLAGAPTGASRVRPLSRWNGFAWMPAGLYLPAHTAACRLDSVDFEPLRAIAARIVLIEALNVLDRANEREFALGISDDDVLNAVQDAVGPDVRLARVSDFVELDQLERQRVEAA